MTTKPRVYVAGPIYGSGKPNDNLRRAIRAAELLREAGAIPFVPHLFLTWEMISPKDTQEYWMEMDFTWIAQCHALVRLDGESPGSEREVVFCQERGIPVFDAQHATGAARSSDGLDGVRHFIKELKGGRFTRHQLEEGMQMHFPFELREVHRTAPKSERPPENVLSESYSDMDIIQEQLAAWQSRNFPNQKPHECILGIVEEVGELCHAHLKEEQGIRGTAEENQAKAQDAIGDALIYLAGYCNVRGWKMSDCLGTAWNEIKDRNWTKYPKNGRSE